METLVAAQTDTMDCLLATTAELATASNQNVAAESALHAHLLRQQRIAGSACPHLRPCCWESCARWSQWWRCHTSCWRCLQHVMHADVKSEPPGLVVVRMRVSTTCSSIAGSARPWDAASVRSAVLAPEAQMQSWLGPCEHDARLLHEQHALHQRQCTRQHQPCHKHPNVQD